MTRVYAAQLAAGGEPHLAALHLLALGDVRAALGVYRAVGMLREAVELAAARLMPGDPALQVWTGLAEFRGCCCREAY